MGKIEKRNEIFLFFPYILHNSYSQFYSASANTQTWNKLKLDYILLFMKSQFSSII